MQQVKLDFDSIARLLTLRYDPGKNPLIRPLVPSDFGLKTFNDVEMSVLGAIKKDILEKHRTMKFKQISIALSGGVDSRLTLAMIRSFLPDIKVNCISVGFGDKDDEVEQAKEIAKVFDCKFYGIILDNILADLPRLISVVKEPRWNLYQFYPFQYGKSLSNIFYTGDGGDELFGGYTFRYRKFLSLMPQGAGWKEKTKLYLSCHERDWVPDQDRIFGPAVRFSWEKIYNIFRPFFDNRIEPLDQVFLADFNGKLLYDWLPTNTAFSKHLTLRTKSLFLSPSMIRLATHVPWRQKYDAASSLGKIPLRNLLSKFEGKEISPAKRGFSLDLPLMWKRYARGIVEQYVNQESEVVRNRIINPVWLKKTYQRLTDDNILDPRYVNKMLSILALEIWYRLFVSGSMKNTQRLCLVLFKKGN